MKKALIWIVVILAILCLVGAIFVNHWADTGHGRLNYKVAVILKFLSLSEDDGSENGSRPSVAESRKRLLEKVEKFSSVPVTVKRVINQKIPGPAVDIPVRIYIPVESKSLPVVLFYHGGGWVQGNLDSHDNLCRYLSVASNAIVVAVDYRLAPEHPFPAGLDDAYAALVWVSENAGSFGGDPARIAVMGDSAGANLSAVLSLMARDRKGPKIARQVLVYPSTDLSRLDNDSYSYFGKGFMLTKANIEWFRALYLPNKDNWTDPYASPLLADDHGHLPPATIITAEMDPLRDEGKQYADKLKKAGVSTNYHCYKGMIHGFVSADKVLNQAHEALDEIALDLKKSF
ncbi:MAG: alpha/beta hydrolase [Desulfobacterales bacterium]|nr:alpha/beta hydrolase [Desulfobacterales bacterium]